MNSEGDNNKYCCCGRLHLEAEKLFHREDRRSHSSYLLTIYLVAALSFVRDCNRSDELPLYRFISRSMRLRAPCQSRTKKIVMHY